MSHYTATASPSESCSDTNSLVSTPPSSTSGEAFGSTTLTSEWAELYGVVDRLHKDQQRKEAENAVLSSAWRLRCETLEREIGRLAGLVAKLERDKVIEVSKILTVCPNSTRLIRADSLASLEAERLGRKLRPSANALPLEWLCMGAANRRRPQDTSN